MLTGLSFLHHSDKLGAVELCILGNGFEHIGDKGQYHIFIDTVLCLAERTARNLRVAGTGILRNALAVVGAMDVHLAAAVRAVHQARKGSDFAPAVRIAADVSPDFLHKVKGLLVDDSFVGVLENRPFVLRDIVAFLVLEVFAGLEIDSMTKVFTLLENFNHGG